MSDAPRIPIRCSLDRFLKEMLVVPLLYSDAIEYAGKFGTRALLLVPILAYLH